MKKWLIDKWHWLLSFNNPPKVSITAESIQAKDGKSIVRVQGRVKVNLNINIMIGPLNESLIDLKNRDYVKENK